MSAKHPSCAIHVRFRPADYLRIRTASLALEITPERFVRALILSAMEYYDQEHPGEAFRIEPIIKDRHPLKLNAQERRARSRRRTAANKARVADILPELIDDYRRLRKRLGAEPARMIIEKRMEIKPLKRKRRKDAGVANEGARARAADPEYYARTLKRGRDANKQLVIDIPTERMADYSQLRHLLGADEARRIIGEEVKRGKARVAAS